MIDMCVGFLEAVTLFQRDIIQGMKSFAAKMQTDLTVYASHRNERNYSRLHCGVLIPFRPSVVACDLKTTTWRSRLQDTGTSGPQWLEMADDKVTFAEVMDENRLPSVPSLRINSITD